MFFAPFDAEHTASYSLQTLNEEITPFSKQRERNTGTYLLFSTSKSS
jgi:hypothetical protein